MRADQTSQTVGSTSGWCEASSCASGRTVRTVDVALSLPQDFDGLSSFCMVVGRCVGGYLCASIIAISAGARPADPLRAAIRLSAVALAALVGGLGGAVIVGLILGALSRSVAGIKPL